MPKAKTPVSAPALAPVDTDPHAAHAEQKDPSSSSNVQSSSDAKLAEKSSKEIGEIGESLAQQFLVRNGYAIREKNWTTPFGEADIIVEKDGVVAMVEVKTRRGPYSRSEMFPELAVDARKQERYVNMAKHYCSIHAELTSIRFDIVALCLFEEHMARLRHIKEAFVWDLA